jgi:hypothetical protein
LRFCVTHLGGLAIQAGGFGFVAADTGPKSVLIRLCE